MMFVELMSKYKTDHNGEKKESEERQFVDLPFSMYSVLW